MTASTTERDGIRWLVWDSVDSTNEAAKRVLQQGDVLQSTVVVVAKHQTAGKGTQGRQWVSPAGGGIYCSVIHPAAVMGLLPLTPLYTLAAGVACAQTVQETTGLTVGLKPVNDLMVGGKKLGGILTESVVAGDEMKALITGVGLNVYDCERLVAGEHTPICLQECVAPHVLHSFNATEWIELLVAKLNPLYQEIQHEQHTTILEQFRRYQLPGTTLPAAIMQLV